MIYISASSIQDYLDCSMKFYLRTNFKDKSKETEAMTVGLIVHEAIEKYWDDSKEMWKFVSAASEQISAEGVEKIQRTLAMFITKFSSLLSEQDLIEEGFKLLLPGYDDVTLVGKWDRILPGGVILDWKTVLRPPKNSTSAIQFLVYYLAYEMKFGRTPSAVYFASLQNGNLIPYIYSSHAEDIFFLQLIPDMIEAIRAGRFSFEGRMNNNKPCWTCNYKDFCWNELDSGNFAIAERQHSSKRSNRL